MVPQMLLTFNVHRHQKQHRTIKQHDVSRYFVCSLIVINLVWSSCSCFGSVSAAWSEGNDLWGKRSGGEKPGATVKVKSHIALPPKNKEAAKPPTVDDVVMHPIAALHPKDVISRQSTRPQKKWQQADTLWGKRGAAPEIEPGAAGASGPDVSDVGGQEKRAWNDGSTMWGKKRRKKDGTSAWSQADSLWG